jgi:hypothetical protein
MQMRELLVSFRAYKCYRMVKRIEIAIDLSTVYISINISDSSDTCLVLFMNM